MISYAEPTLLPTVFQPKLAVRIHQSRRPTRDADVRKLKLVPRAPANRVGSFPYG
jgi:hypothetical protein